MTNLAKAKYLSGVGLIIFVLATILPGVTAQDRKQLFYGIGEIVPAVGNRDQDELTAKDRQLLPILIKYSYMVGSKMIKMPF